MTNKNGATPGPWTVEKNRHPNTDGTPWGVVVSSPHPAGGAGACPAGTSITWSGDTGLANAKLIAEAPNLAIALRDLTAYCRDVVRPALAASAQYGTADDIWRKLNPAIACLRTIGLLP